MDVDEETIRKIFREELAVHTSITCRFKGIKDEDTDKVVGFIQSIATMGEGNLARGVDVVIDNNKWINEVREKGTWASRIAFGLIVSAIVGTMLTITWEGFKRMLSK